VTGDTEHVDPDTFRAESRESWGQVAAGWEIRREQLQRAALPVSRRMVELIRPEPGQTVLELAAGPGDTGLMAAELIAPGGTLILSDVAESMVEVARRRAEELGIANVDFRVLDLEWIDLPTATVDGALCRWGYMLVADPATALRETRRVLRPGGRVALAVWDSPEHNPWLAIGGPELVRRGLADPPEPGEPGPFALADPQELEELMRGAGFGELSIEALDFEMRYADAEHWWDTTLDCARSFSATVRGLEPSQRDDVRAALADQLAEYAGQDGSLAVPARTWVALAAA